MSVNVEWKIDGEHEPPQGIVAEGTYLWDAAKRLGVRLPAECGGKGECDTCAVVVEEGATLLSTLTDAERRLLSPERLAEGERLASGAGRARRPPRSAARARDRSKERRETSRLLKSSANALK